MNKIKMLNSELEEFRSEIPFFEIPGGGLPLRQMVNTLQYHIGYGSYYEHGKVNHKQTIEESLPMLRARIQEVNSDIEHAWFFQKNPLRMKRDILVKIYNYSVYAIDLISKN